MKDFTILLVDDNETLLRSLAHFLRRQGAQVSCASDRESTLARLAEGEHRFCFLSFELARRCSLDLLQRIKDLSPHTAVVLVGAPPRGRDFCATICEPQADGFLLEPFGLDDVRATLAALSERLHRPGQGARETQRRRVGSGSVSGDRTDGFGRPDG